MVVRKLLSTYRLPHDASDSSDLISRAHDIESLQASMLIGDLELIAAHRLTCQSFSVQTKCFSFRFDALPSGGDTVLGVDAGVTHGAEIGPLFQNTEGIGFARNPFLNQSSSYFQMSELMGEMWINFISDLDPNGPSRIDTKRTAWPVYNLQSPQNMVFGNAVPCSTEIDTKRKEGIQYINQINAGLIGR